jgi:uncharacterized protein with GYD domain
MPNYVLLMNWTEQGIQSVKDSVDRAGRGPLGAEGAGSRSHRHLLDDGRS